MIKALLLLYAPNRFVFLNPVWFMKKTEKLFKSSKFVFKENTSAMKNSLLFLLFYREGFFSVF